MALLLLAAPAWVPSPFSYRWGLPADARSFDGLGGGIAAGGGDGAYGGVDAADEGVGFRREQARRLKRWADMSVYVCVC